MNSAIEKLIRADKLIITCKKQAKDLSKNTDKSLMECQNIIAKQIGHYDWHTLYSKVKVKYTNEFNPIEALIINSLINNHRSIHFSFRDDEININIENEDGMRNISDDIDNTFDYLKLFMEKYNHIIRDLLDYSSFNFSYNNGKKTIGYLKYQSIPCYPNGYDIIIGFSLIKYKFPSLSSLGFSKEQIDVLMKAKGLVLFCSNRTQDKFAVIDSLVQEINEATNKQLKIINYFPSEPKVMYSNDYPKFYGFETLEDIQNHTSIQNPDIVKLTRVWDKNLARTAIEVSKKAPLTISSINAGSALRLFDRLNDFGVDKIEESNVNTCVHQLEFPKLCEHCKIKESKDIDYSLKFLPEIIELISKTDLYSRGTGCKHCSNGIKGLTVCAEIVELNEDSWKFIKNEGLEAFKTHWHTLNDKDVFSTNILGKTAYDSAIRKMLEGKLSSQDLFCQYNYLYKPNL